MEVCWKFFDGGKVTRTHTTIADLGTYPPCKAYRYLGLDQKKRPFKRRDGARVWIICELLHDLRVNLVPELSCRCTCSSSGAFLAVTYDAERPRNVRTAPTGTLCLKMKPVRRVSNYCRMNSDSTDDSWASEAKSCGKMGWCAARIETQDWERATMVARRTR